MKNLLSNKTLQATYGGDVIGGSVVPGMLGAIFLIGVSMKGEKESKEKPRPKKSTRGQIKEWAKKEGVKIKTVKGGTTVSFKPKPKKKK